MTCFSYFVVVSSSPSNSNHQLLHVFRMGNSVGGGETNRRPPTIAEEDEEVEEENEKQTPGLTTNFFLILAS